ncbi:MAG: L,D-transpeptidase family protein [Actinomycetota bacterium]
MKKRKHKAAAGFRWLPVVSGLVAVFVLLLAGAAFAGYRFDQRTSTRILPGVRIAGVAVGGMTREQALKAVQGPVDRILDREMTIRAADKVWRVTPRELGMKVAVKAAVDEALSVGGGMGWPSRVFHRLLNRPVDERIAFELKYRKKPVNAFVARVADRVARTPVNASLDWIDGGAVETHSEAGRALRTDRATKAVMAALRNGAARVKLDVKRLAPQVPDEALGKTIIIRTTVNKLLLYDRFDLQKTYAVATGQREYPTPLGHWEIVNKRINPTWVNPALDSWGANSPAYIPPGPDNPLGTRALDLNASGIRIHGTYADESIGTHASHGCIRMHIPDSEELFDLVDVGVPVIIVP